MDMLRLVIGTALGFMAAQGVLYGIKRLIGWLERDEVRNRMRQLTLSRGSIFTGAFNKHVALVAVSAAVVTLGAWAVGDYLGAKSARSAVMANVFDPSTAVRGLDPHGSTDDVAELAPAPRVDTSTATPVEKIDPYNDADFKVQRPHRAGASLSLKEALVQRSEAKARAEVLGETQQHLTRSQYDCEAADRADRYLKAGLDVWGFSAWQLKYFPIEGYKGATLPQCKDIKDVVDPSRLDLQSTAAQQSDPRPVSRNESRAGAAVMTGSELGASRP
jgi:hypothetical protein